jgi:hypothetical protein
MGARNRVGIGLSYRPARLHRLSESIPGLLKSLKIRALLTDGGGGRGAGSYDCKKAWVSINRSILSATHLFLQLCYVLRLNDDISSLFKFSLLYVVQRISERENPIVHCVISNIRVPFREIGWIFF